MERCDQLEKESYRKGYFLGYREGYRDCESGKSMLSIEAEGAAAYPIEVLGLSTRAYHCLRAVGCQCAGDVAKLRDRQILQIRNLGRVTAVEIAQMLASLGIHGSDWEYYLL